MGSANDHHAQCVECDGSHCICSYIEAAVAATEERLRREINAGLELQTEIKLLKARAPKSLAKQFDEAYELRAELDKLRRFVADLVTLGLDIDDPTTSPFWTGKIHDPKTGDLLFDIAAVDKED